jgi:hypothetical protein
LTKGSRHPGNINPHFSNNHFTAANPSESEIFYRATLTP